MKTKLLSVVLALSFAGPAFAASVNKRQHHQQQRIANGVASGELTARETIKVEAREAKINRDEARARADGRFTAAERARIQAEQNRASAAIYRQKHDAQKR